MDQLKTDRQGFNSIYMMFDSGARDLKSKLVNRMGINGETSKSGASVQEIIENPILSNFKEGLSILEHFYFSRCS